MATSLELEQSVSPKLCNSRLRGIFSRHWGFVQELKDAGEMELKHVAGINNAADILTKAFDASSFKRLRRLISGLWRVEKSVANG
jgi:hypothetical protein